MHTTWLNTKTIKIPKTSANIAAFPTFLLHNISIIKKPQNKKPFIL